MPGDKPGLKILRQLFLTALELKAPQRSPNEVNQRCHRADDTPGGELSSLK